VMKGSPEDAEVRVPESRLDELHAMIRSFPDLQMEGPEGLFGNFKLVPVDLLVKAPWNYKEEREDISLKLRENMKRIGQVQNLMVRLLPTRYFEILNGNHRIDEMIALGFRFAFVYDFGGISQHEAERIAVETNETNFPTDQLRLAEIVRDLRQEFPLEDLQMTLPYSEDELDGMQKLLDFDFGDFQQTPDGSGPGEGNVDPKKQILLEVPEETYNLWLKWIDRLEGVLGYRSEEKAFEMAIVEAMNIPEDSLEP
jgi:hypothetical protein